MKILGIETSCDETAICLIEVDEKTREARILGNIVHSQIDVHASYGGVFPTLAKREHQRNLVPVLRKALAEAGTLEEAAPAPMPEKIKEILAREPELLEAFTASALSIKKPDIDYISVTVGPGLEPALWVGINFARALATLWNVPIIPANHMEGHILTALVRKNGDSYKIIGKEITFPALSLLISGGHTEIVLIEKPGSYRIVGETRDDAVGECFDKIARTLGLAYPGGPKISKLAAEARAEDINSPEPLPRPMIDSKDLDFSFSGLKTAVLYLVKRLTDAGALDERAKKGICREAEDSIMDVLTAKMRKAAETYAARSIVVGGGVIANTRIRQALETLAADSSLDMYLPQTDHATDNGLMIALAGFFNIEKAVSAETDLKANGTLRIGK
ncbi:MAG TPA: tRNA (adenosine(37)-N6)-threonylcarbamoyltransferase complex transferase subunit TsaD [Candidatus Paceibacterota bacterium]|nr:tRNA (adenosine(37)-N6)-threonylcarbamoyltransferase complex transferase subunit TsaD [Candidatus Paceibacterota bacterium]